MGMDADVIVIGPKKILSKAYALDYCDESYVNVPDDAVVLGTVAEAETTTQSCVLAAICGVSEWDLGNHRVTKPVNPRHFRDDQYIGGQRLQTIHSKLVVLMGRDNVQVWYRPNG